jgi:hypothetical protein
MHYAGEKEILGNFIAVKMSRANNNNLEIVHRDRDFDSGKQPCKNGII